MFFLISLHTAGNIALYKLYFVIRLPYGHRGAYSQSNRRNIPPPRLSTQRITLGVFGKTNTVTDGQKAGRSVLRSNNNGDSVTMDGTVFSWSNGVPKLLLSRHGGPSSGNARPSIRGFL